MLLCCFLWHLRQHHLPLTSCLSLSLKHPHTHIYYAYLLPCLSETQQAAALHLQSTSNPVQHHIAEINPSLDWASASQLISCQRWGTFGIQCAKRKMVLARSVRNEFARVYNAHGLVQSFLNSGSWKIKSVWVQVRHWGSISRLAGHGWWRSEGSSLTLPPFWRLLIKAKTAQGISAGIKVTPESESDFQTILYSCSQLLVALQRPKFFFFLFLLRTLLGHPMATLMTKA